MRITGRALRQIIRETLTAEGPLAGVGDYSTDPIPAYHRKRGMRKDRPSIGRRTLRQPEGRAEAEVLFKNTADNWVIVTLDHVDSAGEIFTSPRFDAWLARQKFPPDARILVISGSPYKGDFTSVQWTVAHDIIGHTLADWTSKFFTAPEKRHLLGDAKGVATAAILSLLPKSKRVGDDADDLPDALAGLFFGDVTAGAAKAAAQEMTAAFPSLAHLTDAVGEVIDIYDRGIKDWIYNIPPGRPIPIRPF
jgi:hypothetical protein